MYKEEEPGIYETTTTQSDVIIQWMSILGYLPLYYMKRKREQEQGGKRSE